MVVVVVLCFSVVPCLVDVLVVVADASGKRNYTKTIVVVVQDSHESWLLPDLCVLLVVGLVEEYKDRSVPRLGVPFHAPLAGELRPVFAGTVGIVVVPPTTREVVFQSKLPEEE